MMLGFAEPSFVCVASDMKGYSIHTYQQMKKEEYASTPEILYR